MSAMSRVINVVAQALRSIHDERALELGALQDVSGVDVLHVERRVLAHQDRVQLGEARHARLAELEPVLEVVADAQGTQAPEGDAVAQPQIALLGVPERPAALLCGEQHRERRVLGRLDRRNGIHDNDDLNGHRVFL
jgi:hypothetical protein